jgi:hypothetical protein
VDNGAGAASEIYLHAELPNTYMGMSWHRGEWYLEKDGWQIFRSLFILLHIGNHFLRYPANKI